MNSIQAIAQMLRYRRPHRSKTERRFIQRFIADLPGVKHDKFGNRIVRIGDAPILYSSHTDSVHRMAGMQDIAISPAHKFKLSHKSISNCLGADNAAGVWLMREMILAGKPGLYIFHRGEESGGLGSRWLTKNTPDVAKDIKVAMAFDRRNTKSIITKQWGGRCCSDEFAESLANELHLGHKKDTGGSFTDTANYTDLVPECTNVSVGFDSEHSPRETLDMDYLIELRQSMLELDWEKLVIKRKAGEKEPVTYYQGWGEEGYSSAYPYRYRWSKELHGWEAWDTDTQTWEPEDVVKQKVAKRPKETPSQRFKRRGKWDARPKSKEIVYTLEDDKETKPVGFLSEGRQGDLLPDGYELGNEDKPGSNRKHLDHDCLDLMVRNNPAQIVQLLEDYGIDADEVADFLQQSGGTIPWQMYSAKDE